MVVGPTSSLLKFLSFKGFACAATWPTSIRQEVFIQNRKKTQVGRNQEKHSNLAPRFPFESHEKPLDLFLLEVHEAHKQNWNEKSVQNFTQNRTL